MRDQGIAGHRSAPIPTGSVAGLGICDVWRLELSAVQLPWLIDEIEALRWPLEEALERVRSEHAAAPDESSAEELSAREYELRLLAMMRRQLPPAGDRAPVMFAGPSELVRMLVRGTVRDAVSVLGDVVDAVGPGDARGRERLAAVAEAACAWIHTYIDCQELEEYSFDPAVDPVQLR